MFKNGDGYEYYKGSVQLEENNGSIGIDNMCRTNIPELPDVYTDLINGKTIIIEVTQMVDGKEVISSASGNLNSMLLLYDTYYTSNLALAVFSMTGC